ncbi:MAG: cell division protein FtsZ [Candidatus Marinimicrobia bacterium]|nr:cell division protein FtsZ [Candidatus Neomarinimicrobiota bacterium]
MLFEFDDLANQQAKLKVIGVGGGGGNAINRMIESGLTGVDFIAINTDAQDLDNNLSPTKIQIGKDLTRGLGAGAVKEIGKMAMEADRQPTLNSINGADMVFITAGMGGGTGTGASPLIAKLAKDQGCLTVGIITKPFHFEGPKRMQRAEEGIRELRDNVDTLIVIPNQRLLSIVDRKTSIRQAFHTADSVLYQATKGISDLINRHGIINLDFADIKTIMKNMGDAIMGTGLATGEERAVLAAQQAISSPLLNDMNIRGANGLLINVTGGEDLNLFEVDEACKIITEEAGSDADIIIGAVIDEKMSDEIMITVIATGFGNDNRSTYRNSDSIIISTKEELFAEEISAAKEYENNDNTEIENELIAEPALKISFEDDEKSFIENATDMNDKNIPAILRKMMKR